MRNVRIGIIAIILSAFCFCGASAESEQKNETADVPVEEEKMEAFIDKTPRKREDTEIIYFAGGCFWGIEKLMSEMPGVVDAVSGYANGKTGYDPNYQVVCSGETGFRETVRVEYDPKVVSLDGLLFAYFSVIDPTVKDRQGNDSGSQYQTGIYYIDEAAQKTVERVAAIEKKRSVAFYVEIKPLENFYAAEDYHQDYLEKNPGGYCHIPQSEISTISQMIVDPGNYIRPDDAQIENMLSPEAYDVTQNNGTELPFDNAYWDNHEKGIYVDIVTGEPLFTSEGKYDSSCGWPSFYEPIDPNVIVYEQDTSHGLDRTEVRSRAGNSHLGHIFENEPESPNGIRYCIDSASLRFVPYDQMDDEGYGYLKKLFDQQ